MTKAAELAKMGEVLTNSQLGGRRNIVINGAMQISQRATSATGLGGDGSNGYFTVDRFKSFSAGTAGRYTQSQSAITDLPGFAKALKFDCTTADTSIAAGEYLILQQNFEGQDLQQIKKGTSSAEKVTVSFYVKGNANATYALELLDVDNSRTTTKLFNVTSSWNRISLTFDADTTGAFDDDTAESLRLFWWLHAGSTYTGGTLNTTWASSSTTANRVAGISSFFDSTDRTFFITGVQLEVGSQATPFEHRSFGEELALCQRYYYRRTISSAGFNNEYFSAVYAYGTTDVQGGQLHPVQMRAIPSVTFDGILKITNGSAAASHTGASSFSFTSYSSVDNLSLYTHSSCFSGLTQHRAYMMYGDTNDFIEVSSEL
tara:strand:- start:143 stop:1264 length:1122 start_codon:yes stop_codon:yes gene_type:complete